MTQYLMSGGLPGSTPGDLTPDSTTMPCPTPSRDVEALVQNAVFRGTNISGQLANGLRQGDLADSVDLRKILSLAEELRNYQSPVEFTIGVVGDVGVGK
jgi:hypothetical protein